MVGASTVVFVLALIVSGCALGLSYYVLQKLILLEQKERSQPRNVKSCKRVRIEEVSESEDESEFEEVTPVPLMTKVPPTPVVSPVPQATFLVPEIVVTPSTPEESEDEE